MTGAETGTPEPNSDGKATAPVRSARSGKAPGKKAAKQVGGPADGDAPKGRIVHADSHLFEQCYRGRVVPEEEWPAFVSHLRKELPVTFRFAKSHPLGGPLEDHLANEFLRPGALDGDEPSPAEDQDRSGTTPEGEVRRLGRLPGLANAWVLNVPKAALRRAAGPKRLHCLLKMCTELGCISRQEAVSMVPALLLGGGPGLRVLDLCASPGMKTLQLLDDVPPPGVGDSATAAVRSIEGAGAVVCNELDGRRCCMLAHHVLKTRSPAGVVLHHDALCMPALGAEGFDRVLCDVPCSGDGTIRKAPQILSSWRPNSACALHRLQLRIACAGAAQLKVGGRMVYSTCALSPIENEAVVAALVLRANGALQLVDCSDELAGMPRLPGLTEWAVPAGSRHCHNVAFLEGPDEAAARGLDLPGSAWPPAGPECHKIGLPADLSRCWRMYPHRGDSGGFFVACLKLVGELPSGFISDDLCAPQPAQSLSQQAAVSVVGEKTSTGGTHADVSKVDAGADEELAGDAVCKAEFPAAQSMACLSPAAQNGRLQSLLEDALAFYGLEDLGVDNLFVRNEGEGRHVYLVSDAVRDLLLAGEQSGTEPVDGAPHNFRQQRVFIAGVRVFDETRFLKNSACRVRLCQEGLRWLAPAMKRRCCPATPAEMALLLAATDRHGICFKHLAADSVLRRSVEAVAEQGSIAVVCPLPSGGSLYAAAERGAECVSLFVQKVERRELLQALGHFMPIALAADSAAVPGGTTDIQV